MKIKVLEYFITLAESRSINEAAQKLYIAQPSLTKSLHLFEEEIGVRLFVRNNAGTQLTEAGKRLLREPRQIVAYYNGGLEMSSQRPLQAVHIYIQSSFPNFIIPDVILEFKKQHPNVQIHCEVTGTPEQYISRDTERPVLALFVCGQDNPPERYAKIQGNPPITLFQGEYCCLVNRSSKLAQRDSVTPEDLRDYYLALRSRLEAPSLPLAPLLDRIVPTVSPAHTIQMESVDSIIQLVHSHPDVYALSYYPILYRYEGVLSGELTYVPFSGDYAKGSFCLFCSKQACRQYPDLQALVNAIQAAATRFLSETGC
mgnify:CR=1 FL=1